MYEGQAAIELEALAEPSYHAYPFLMSDTGLDVTPIIRSMVDDLRNGAAKSYIAGRFHRSVAEMLVAACVKARQASGVNQVALSGGVSQNRLLLQQLILGLEKHDFVVYINRQVPPNDGGLSFGQAAIAAARLRAELV
jgi:hydrogenase maturation protein HypF